MEGGGRQRQAGTSTHAHGSPPRVTGRRTAAAGIHAPLRASTRRCVPRVRGPANRSFRTQKRPSAHMYRQRPSRVATGVPSPYARRLREKNGLESRITGKKATVSVYSKVIHRFARADGRVRSRVVRCGRAMFASCSRDRRAIRTGPGRLLHTTPGNAADLHRRRDETPAAVDHAPGK